MRILITGAAGFIGSHLTDRFLSEGHDVIGVDNLSSGRISNLAAAQHNPRFRFVEHDVIHPFQEDGELDWILHFASLASPPKYLAMPIQTLRVNSEGTFHLLELARRKGAALFLASTSEVYGDPKVHPQPESYWGNVNPAGPRSSYDEAKRYAEAITTAYSTKFGLDIRIIRIFNTYGPRMDPDDGRVITNLITQALRGESLTIYGDGSQTRSFQYIDDLVNGIALLMKVKYNRPVNLGNTEEYTILQFARIVKELTGGVAKLEFRPLPVDDPKQRRPDISLARNLLQWQPTVEIRDGLRRTIEYFKNELKDTTNIEAISEAFR
jgi:dTDP-glucose 4,6-dehydratase